MSLPIAGLLPVNPPASFEIKSAQLEAMALLVKTPDLETLVAHLLATYGPKGETPQFFDNDAVVLDFSALLPNAQPGDIPRLLDALKQCCLVAVAVRGGPSTWLEQAQSLGLVVVPDEVIRTKAIAVVSEVKETVREVPGPGTMVVDKPLRSGQKIYARGADLVVLAMVNQGAEVAADGNIHVYAPLRGKAMAGARGNTQARIFSLCMEPELVSIAGVYRTSENALPASVQGKPAQVRLSNDGNDKLIFEALEN